MKLAVKDACIIIDLIDLDLLHEFFNLNLDIITTDLAINEIKTYSHKNQLIKFTKTNKLRVEKLSFAELSESVKIRNKYKKLILTDCTVIYKAKQNNCMILSSDNVIRKYAKIENIEIHGTIWIIEQLVNSKLIQKQTGILKLNQLMNINNRIPVNSCNDLINKWSK